MYKNCWLNLITTRAYIKSISWLAHVNTYDWQQHIQAGAQAASGRILQETTAKKHHGETPSEDMALGYEDVAAAAAEDR